MGIGTDSPEKPLHVSGDSLLSGTATIAGDLLPVFSGTQDIGSQSEPFRHIYTEAASLYMGYAKLWVNEDGNLTFTPEGEDPVAVTSGTASTTVNLIETGSFLHDQIISNDTDISTLTSNLGLTGIDLRIDIDTLSGNFTGEGNYVPRWDNTYPYTLTKSQIYDNGNVGIGTTDPTGKFHIVNDDDSVKDIFVVEDSTHFDETRFVINSGGRVGVQQPEPEHDVHVGTGDLCSFLVTTGGLVGIGTNNPTGLVHIVGGTNYFEIDGHPNHLFIVEDGPHPDDAPFVIESGGNVGIGINDPTAKLHVNGSFRLADGTQQNNYVLTSDANGNADWQAAGGGVTEAFVMFTR